VPMVGPSDVIPGQVSAEAGRAVLRAITISPRSWGLPVRSVKSTS